MQFANGVAAAVGRTPLIKLRRASRGDRLYHFGQGRFMNPGQSVKDRAALFIIQGCYCQGAPEAGRHHRRGNCRQYWHRPCRRGHALGFRCVIVIPVTQSQEKKDAFVCWARNLSKCRLGLQRSQQLREILRALAKLAMRPKAPSGPTSLTMSPTAGPTSKPPRRNLDRDRRQGRCLCLCRRFRWNAGRRELMGSNPKIKIKLVLADPWVRPSTAITRPAS